MKRFEYKGKNPEFSREMLNLRDVQDFVGCAQHLVELHLKSEFSSSVGHCALVMTAELGSKCFGMYLERWYSMIVSLLSLDRSIWTKLRKGKKCKLNKRKMFLMVNPIRLLKFPWGNSGVLFFTTQDNTPKNLL